MSLHLIKLAVGVDDLAHMKKVQAARRKQKQVHVKEIKFRPGTDEGDYKIKLRKLVEFLEDDSAGE